MYPAGTTRPGASNLNVVAGQTIPNLVTVALGSGNRVTLYNASGTIDLIADLAGYYSSDAGAGFTAVSPVRVLDTRTGVGAPTAKVRCGRHGDGDGAGVCRRGDGGGHERDGDPSDVDELRERVPGWDDPAGCVEPERGGGSDDPEPGDGGVGVG